MTKTDTALPFKYTPMRARNATYQPTKIVGYMVHEIGADGWSNHYIGEVRKDHVRKWSARTALFGRWEEQFQTRHAAATWLKDQYDTKQREMSWD